MRFGEAFRVPAVTPFALRQAAGSPQAVPCGCHFAAATCHFAAAMGDFAAMCHFATMCNFAGGIRVSKVLELTLRSC